MKATAAQTAWTRGHDAGYQAGYQAALDDVLAAYERGGQDAALEWIETNQMAAETERTNPA